MVNANIRIKRWIVEILEINSPLTANQILYRIKEKGIRNIPTLPQLNSVLGKHCLLKRIETYSSGGYNPYLWRLRD